MKFIKTVVIVVLLTQSFDMMGLDVRIDLGKVNIINKIRELFRGKTNVVFRGKLLPTDRLKQPLANIDLDIISVPEDGFSNGFQSVKDAKLLGSVRTGAEGEFIINVDLTKVQDISTLESIAWGRLAFRYRTSYWGNKIWGYDLFSTFRRGDFPKPTYEGNNAIYNLADARVDAMKTLKVRFVFIAKNAANQEMEHVKVRAQYTGTGDYWGCRGVGGRRTVANKFPFGSHKSFICKHQRGSQIYPVTVGRTSIKYNFEREGYVKIEDAFLIEKNRAPDHYTEDPDLGTIGYYVSQTNLDLSYHTELYTRKCLDTCCSQIEPLQTNDCRSLNLGLRYKASKASQSALASSNRSDRGSGAVKQGLTICASDGKIDFGGQFPLVLDRTVRGSVVHSAGSSGFTKVYDLPDSWNDVRYQFPGAGCAEGPPNNVFYQIDGGSRQNNVTRKYYILIRRRSDVLYIDARGYGPSKEMGMSLLSNSKEEQGVYLDLRGRSISASKKYFLFSGYQPGAPFRLKIKPVLSTGIYNYLFRGNRAKEIDSAHSAVAREPKAPKDSQEPKKSSNQDINPYVVDLVPTNAGKEGLTIRLHNCLNNDFSSNRCDTYPLGKLANVVSLAVGYLEDETSTTCNNARYEDLPSSTYAHAVQNGVDVLLFNKEVKSFDCISYVSDFTSETRQRFIRSASNRDDFSVGSGRSEITVINLYRNWAKPIEDFTPGIWQTTKKGVALYSRPTRKASFQIRQMPHNALLWASFGYLINGKKWFWVSYSSGDASGGYIFAEDGLSESLNAKFELDVYHVASDGIAVNFRNSDQKLADVCFSSSFDECSDLSNENNVIANTGNSAATYTFDIADYFTKRKFTSDEFSIILEAESDSIFSFLLPNIRKRISVLHDYDGNWRLEVSKERKVFYFETDESFGFDYNSTGVSPDNSDIVDATSADDSDIVDATSTDDSDIVEVPVDGSGGVRTIEPDPNHIFEVSIRKLENDSEVGYEYGSGGAKYLLCLKREAGDTEDCPASFPPRYIVPNQDNASFQVDVLNFLQVSKDNLGDNFSTLYLTFQPNESLFGTEENATVRLDYTEGSGWKFSTGENIIYYVINETKAYFSSVPDFAEAGEVTPGIYRVNSKTLSVRESPDGERKAGLGFVRKDLVEIVSAKLYRLRDTSMKGGNRNTDWAAIHRLNAEPDVIEYAAYRSGSSGYFYLKPFESEVNALIFSGEVILEQTVVQYINDYLGETAFDSTKLNISLCFPSGGGGCLAGLSDLDISLSHSAGNRYSYSGNISSEVILDNNLTVDEVESWLDNDDIQLNITLKYDQ